jgi:hypothetical protein
MKKRVSSIVLCASLIFGMEESFEKNKALGLRFFTKKTYSIEHKNDGLCISSGTTPYSLFIKKDEVEKIKEQAQKNLDRVNLFTPVSYRMRKLKQSIAPIVLTTVGCFNLYQAFKRGPTSEIDLLTINLGLS